MKKCNPKLTRVLATLVAVVALLSLSACSLTRTPAKNVVEAALKAAQTVDTEAIHTYWGGDSFKDLESDEDQETRLEIMKLMLGGMTYNIVNSVEDAKAGVATVTVEITNVDMQKIMTSFLTQMLSNAFSYAFLPDDQQPTDEEMDAMYLADLTSLLSQDNNPTVTNTVDIELNLVDDEWKIVPSDEAIDAMLGGISSFTDALENAVTFDEG